MLNLDIRITSDPFPALPACLRASEIGVAVTMIRHPARVVENGASRFPTFWVILKKILFRRIGLAYEFDQDSIHPDLVAGTFMLFRRDAHLSLGDSTNAIFSATKMWICAPA